MPDIGKVLREAREAKGFSLKEVSEMTKIQIRYLKALEDNNLSVFPGEVYSRGAIRNYAEAVGLNAEEIISMHRELNKKKEEEAETKKDTAQVPEKKAATGKNFKHNWLKILAALVIIVLIISVFYYFITKGNDSSNQGKGNEINENQQNEIPEDGNSEDENPEDEQKTGEEQKDEIPAETTLEVILAHSSSASDSYHVKKTEHLILNITFSGRCWVRVKEGELKLISKNYNAGDVCLIERGKEIAVRLGNPAGIREMKVNDLIIPVRNQTTPYNIIISPIK